MATQAVREITDTYISEIFALSVEQVRERVGFDGYELLALPDQELSALARAFPFEVMELCGMTGIDADEFMDRFPEDLQAAFWCLTFHLNPTYLN